MLTRILATVFCAGGLATVPAPRAGEQAVSPDGDKGEIGIDPVTGGILEIEENFF